MALLRSYACERIFKWYFFARTRASELMRQIPVARTRASYKKSQFLSLVRVRAAASQFVLRSYPCAMSSYFNLS